MRGRRNRLRPWEARWDILQNNPQENGMTSRESFDQSAGTAPQVNKETVRAALDSFAKSKDYLYGRTFVVFEDGEIG